MNGKNRITYSYWYIYSKCWGYATLYLYLYFTDSNWRICM